MFPLAQCRFEGLTIEQYSLWRQNNDDNKEPGRWGELLIYPF